ncbi:MAG: WD40 repeat domain-containing protein, partial [Planctomycetaceae bacterium]
MTASRDGTARIWEASSGQPLQILHGHTEFLIGAAFSRDGRRVVTTSADTTARVWDATTGEHQHCQRGHTRSVMAATFGANDRSLVTGSDDGTAKLWELEASDEMTLSPVRSNQLHPASLHPDGT